jgi:hypothetical protein
MFLKNILLLFNIFDYTKLQKYKTNKAIFSSGFDERFMNFNDTDKSIIDNNNITRINEINKIKINYKKKILLDKLLDEKNTIFEKLNLLNHNDNSIKPPNIKAGGLIKDDIFYTF